MLEMHFCKLSIVIKTHKPLPAHIAGFCKPHKATAHLMLAKECNFSNAILTD
jgi:hypothetical protein